MRKRSEDRKNLGKELRKMAVTAWSKSNRSMNSASAAAFAAVSSALLLIGALSILLGVFHVSVAVVISSILIIAALSRRVSGLDSEQSR